MLHSSHVEKTRPVSTRRARWPVSVAPEYLEPPAREELPHIDKDCAAIVLDEWLVHVAHHESACRLSMGRLAARLLESRAHHQLGFARLGDYTLERLGLSAREIQSAARVSRAVEALPRLGEALRSRELNWTKLRTVCEIATAADVEHWISLAQGTTSRELDAHVHEQRRAGRSAQQLGRTGVGSTATGSTAIEGATLEGSTVESTAEVPADCTNQSAVEIAVGREAGVDDIDLVDGEPRAEIHIRCPGQLRSLWRDVAELASRSAGSVLSDWQALELAAAEAAASDRYHGNTDANTHANDQADDHDNAPRWFDTRVRIAGDDDDSRREQRASSWDGELEVLRALVAGNGHPAHPGVAGLSEADPVDHLATNELNADQFTADQLDDALRDVLASMRNIDWQLGRLLATFSRLRLHRHIGYSSLAVYVRDRLGLSSRKASSLVRIEGNPAEGRGELAAAYRAGRISWVRTIALLPVTSRWHSEAWIERAEQVTVRRLFDEVRWALDMRDRSWIFMELVPPSLGATLEHSDAEAERQMRAHYDADTVERIKQRPHLDTTYLRFSGPASVIEFFHDVLQSYADLHAPWEPAWKALERLLRHVKAQWSAVPRHPNPIHERDGWRCRVPACSARRNLQEHHVLFRSRGGGNQRGNRISICAWHHLRGIHAGLMRAHGDATTGIHWQLGNKLRLTDDCYAERPG